MTLTVEDGTGVTGADSYISLAAARAYLDTRGLSLDASQSHAEIQLRKAFDYIESLRFNGKPVSADQATAWPRTDVYINGELLDYTVIPSSVGYAQARYAAAIHDGLELQPNSSGQASAIREKIGPIEVEYASSSSATPLIRAADALLKPYLASVPYLSVDRA